MATLTVIDNLLPRTGVGSCWNMFVSPLHTLSSLREQPRVVAATAFAAAYAAGLSYYVIQRVGLRNILESTIRAQASVDPDALIESAMMRKDQILMLQGVSGFVGTFIAVFGIALLYWLLLLVLGGDSTYERVAAVTAHVVLFTTVIKQTMVALAATMTPNPAAFNIQQPLATNLAFFLRPHSPALMQLTRALDIIALAGLFLTTYGLRKVGDRLSIYESAAVVLLPWSCYVAAKMLIPALT